ncbi:MAG TPA: DUF3108 domain-containing protein [Noviherbaspirillum sp.]|uniref:DUF3108 domain-containing protein n=1 Tax=Noviherbaspirillum sp. TaxID=1926288 RepID=UPI002B4721E2|nr:DUF3108 domain-containing protein [Noviherbaspirillum sp.]HJV87279.1 DUF3108 domain-containing protein [Noviherbaspirillum sp.]
MPLIHPSTTEPPRANARSHRWVAVLLASLLLHLVAFNWVNGHIAMPSWHQDREDIVTASLLTAPPKVVTPPAPVIARPKPRPRPRPKPRRRAAPPPQPVEQNTTALTPPPAVPQDTDLASTESAGDTTADPAADATAEETATAPTTPDAPPAPRFKFDPPPSAELTYDVFALRDQQKWYGSGAFHWESAGGSYRIAGEANVTFIFKITVLNFQSEGMINALGIAPVLYSEKPWRKSLTNTHFQHDARKITFSASEATFPYTGGEQDRASIIWQLAGIGRGDPSQFQPGTALDVTVAGARDADSWHFQLLGEEQVDTPYGKLAAWHVVRVPRPDSHDQKIDIWLASHQDWYPVKVRYTYSNGDYLDMALSSLTPQAQQAH